MPVTGRFSFREDDSTLAEAPFVHLGRDFLQVPGLQPGE
jgi:hypothetical protein